MAKVSHLPELRHREADTAREESGASSAELPVGMIGWIAAWTSDGLFVNFEGNPSGLVLAKSLIDWPPDQIQNALETRRSVLLVFEQGDPRRPVIVGITKSVPCPDFLLASNEGNPIQVKADGQRLEVSARDEVVLRCGEASITLRRNGRVIIKGAHVETRARGTNRIKGGNVLIN